MHKTRSTAARFITSRGPCRMRKPNSNINTVAAAAGISLPDTAPSLLFAPKLEVLIWPLRRAE